MSPDKLIQAEGHKCLANVALCTGQAGIRLQGNDTGGGTMSGGYTDAAVDEALRQLDAGIQASPQDLSIHQGRLHILEVAFRFDAMDNALDESLNVYKGSEGIDPWIPYSAELLEDNHLHAALSLLKVLDKHFPNSHDVIGNMGVAYQILKDDDHAIEMLRRAAALDPTDSIDTWNVAREYDFTKQTSLAEEWYQKAFAIEKDPARRKISRCTYSTFVAEQLRDAARACHLQIANCEEKERTACTATKQ